MELLLKKQELLDFGKDLRGVEIACIEGRCWATQEGDSRDHILSSGSRLKVFTNGKLVITATEPCRLMLSKPDGHAQRFHRVFYEWLEVVQQKVCKVKGKQKRTAQRPSLKLHF